MGQITGERAVEEKAGSSSAFKGSVARQADRVASWADVEWPPPTSASGSFSAAAVCGGAASERRGGGGLMKPRMC